MVEDIALSFSFRKLWHKMAENCCIMAENCGIKLSKDKLEKLFGVNFVTCAQVHIFIVIHWKLNSRRFSEFGNIFSSFTEASRQGITITILACQLR